MELYMILLLLFLIIIASKWILKSRREGKKLPAITGLPILGYIPFLTSRPYMKLFELSKKYGPLYKMRLGSVDFVMVCDSKTINSALLNQNFNHRPVDQIFNAKESSISGTNAFSFDVWKERRRICQQIMHEIGLGNVSDEKKIKEAIVELTSRLQQTKNEPIFIRPYLTGSVSSVIFSWVFGKRVSQDDQMHQHIAHLIEKSGFISPLSWRRCFPWIQTVGHVLGLFSYINPAAELRKILSKEVDTQEETYDKNNIKSLLNSHIQSYDLNYQTKIDSDLKKAIIEDIAVAFYMAGSQTSRSVTEWVLLIIAAFPDVQKRIHNELDREFGKDVFPNYQNRYKTPYTEAVICETFRWIPFGPISSPKYSMTDVEFCGYIIPKNTHIIELHYSTLYDEKLYGDKVDTFRPERFLSEDGLKLVKPKYFVPFSLGRRSCPGRPHAEIEVYLTVAAILQKFNISPPKGKAVNLKGILNSTYEARSQELCFEYRNYKLNN